MKMTNIPRRAGKSAAFNKCMQDLGNGDHVDYFGQPIEVGDYVAAACPTFTEPTIAIYEIKRFRYVLYRTDNESKRVVSVELLRLGSKTSATSERRAENVIKIDPALLTFMKLKS